MAAISMIFVFRLAYMLVIVISLAALVRVIIVPAAVLLDDYRPLA